MANLDALVKYYQQKADENSVSTKAAIDTTYGAQDQSTQDKYNALIAQKQQGLQAIPTQFQPARESAYLASQKAALAAPAVTSNAGYASGSGLNYDYLQGVNSTWQKSVDTANKGQDAAALQAQGDINNTGIQYQTDLSALRAQKATELAALDQQMNTWAFQSAQGDYGNQLQAEAAAAARAQAQAQYDRDMAEKQREYNQSQAAQQQAATGTQSKAYSTYKNGLQATLNGAYSTVTRNYGGASGSELIGTTSVIPDQYAQPLLNAIYSSDLTPQDQVAMIDSYNMTLSNGQTLASYSVNGLKNMASSSPVQTKPQSFMGMTNPFG